MDRDAKIALAVLLPLGALALGSMAWIVIASRAENGDVAVARRLVEREGCCSIAGPVNGRDGALCRKCAELEGAHVVGQRVTTDCGPGCKKIDLDVDARGGRQSCAFTFGDDPGGRHATGSCHPPP